MKLEPIGRLEPKAPIAGCLSWSPDGSLLAVAHHDGNMTVWDVGQQRQHHVVASGRPPLLLSWSPDGSRLATLNTGGHFSVFDMRTFTRIYSSAYIQNAASMTWLEDGQTVVIATGLGRLLYWDVHSRVAIRTSPGTDTGVDNGYDWVPRQDLELWHPNDPLCFVPTSTGISCLSITNGHEVRKLKRNFPDRNYRVSPYSLSQSRDSRWLAESGDSQLIRIWELQNGRQKWTLEGHLARVGEMAFSADNTLFASRSYDDHLVIWSTATWKPVLKMASFTNEDMTGGLAFHPECQQIAVVDAVSNVIDIYRIECEISLRPGDEEPSEDPTVAGTYPAAPAGTVYYTNAKVVLMGDSGVGKSGLSLVLTNQPFTATDSTHARKVRMLHRDEVTHSDGSKSIREILLWDLAGQPGYRLVHQLHLADVALAAIVFDSRCEIDPYAGIVHWDRALRVAQRVGERAPGNIKKLLVGGRIDRGPIGMSQDDIDRLVEEFQFSGYFETSAKDGRGIRSLKEAIESKIDWDYLPTVSSSELIQDMRGYLSFEATDGRILSGQDDLFRGFCQAHPDRELSGSLRNEFDACIGHLESQGLIRQLRFGSLVLLQPELLDAYASAIVNAARDTITDDGCILEYKVRNCSFPIPKDVRLKDSQQEKLLVIATIEDLLRHEIALREHSECGEILVFPSQFTRKHPELPEPRGSSVILEFEGPVLNIYCTLAVRLAHSEFFRRSEMWKNAAVYDSVGGGRCGIFLTFTSEASASITLFFSEDSPDVTRFQFEEYVRTHLLKRAMVGSIRRRRLFACSRCAVTITSEQASRRRNLGYVTLNCPVCETPISLKDTDEIIQVIERVPVQELDRAADARRELDVAVSTLQGKRATDDVDIVLVYREYYRGEVSKLAVELERRGNNVKRYPITGNPLNCIDSVLRHFPSARVVGIVIGQLDNDLTRQVDRPVKFGPEAERVPTIVITLPGVDWDMEVEPAFKKFSRVRFGVTLDEVEPTGRLAALIAQNAGGSYYEGTGMTYKGASNMSGNAAGHSALMKRIEQLEERVKESYELLGEYEKSLIYEDDPRRKSRFKQQIADLRVTATEFQREYDAMHSRFDGRDIVEEPIRRELHHLGATLEQLIERHAQLGGDLVSIRSFLIKQYPANDQALIAPLLAQLNANQVSEVRNIIKSLDDPQVTDDDAQSVVESVRAAIGSVLELSGGESPMAESLCNARQVLDDPKVEWKHKLKVTVPMIPGILSYEGELGLNNAMNLRKMWEALSARARGTR